MYLDSDKNNWAQAYAVSQRVRVCPDVFDLCELYARLRLWLYFLHKLYDSLMLFFSDFDGEYQTSLTSSLPALCWYLMSATRYRCTALDRAFMAQVP